VPPLKGSTVTVLIRTVTGAPDTYTAVGSQRELTRSFSTDTIETTSKDDEDKTFLAGKRGSTLSMSALYVPGDAAKAALMTAYEAGDLIRLRRSAAGADLARQADAVITSLEETFNDGEASMFSAEFAISGGWTATS
jgi:TP901-1 family phage major tail protein